MNLFYKLKLNSYKLLALTSMGPNNPYIDQESDRVNILQDMAIIFEKINFQFNIDKQDRPQPFIKHGVIFARGYEKGVVLKHLLENFHFNESVNLIFIDDMTRNIDSVRNHISSKVNTMYLILHEFIEPHYELDEQITEIQKEYSLNHNVWLSDKQARIYLDSGK